ncbi:MAG: hypothetical protein A2Z15_06365 [Chloroflexi bacterium RBG_16_50_11]|nr:MAG: hypothetical protein A2Z15_06365 [Chloroflexi bacterium RBG_16_50_11]
MLERSLRNRYSRQTIFPGIGEDGQARLVKSKAVIIGCGALGSNVAVLLARAGVGSLTIVDRDFIEVHNLQRQVLFNEEDIKAGLPKAVAAERRLRKINSTIDIRGIIADVNYTNIEEFCRGADVIVDGLDNAETRYLINDAALKHRIPWVYGGAIAANGMTMTIVPGRTPCFRCISPVTPTPETTLTCETAGIVGTAPAIIGALQATEAMKLIIGKDEINPCLIYVDVWGGFFDRIEVKSREGCPACNGKYEYLEKKFEEKVTSLCGQSRAVQVLDTRIKSVAFDKIVKRLGKDVKNIIKNDYMLSFQAGDQEIMVFQDGRAIVKNTISNSEASGLFDKYVRRNI